jgi:anaerobic selenocysteine-containing dehydrogenase
MNLNFVNTTCPYCACGCGMILEILDGKIVSTTPSKTSPTNKGKLCVKGWNVHEFIQHPDRLKSILNLELNIIIA